MLFSVSDLLSHYGYFLIFLFVFAETGLLVGFFLPGDTLLVFAGFFASEGKLSIPVIIIVAIIAALLGDTTGYNIGKRGGRKLFKKDDSIFFSKSHLEKAEVFYEKHGSITVVIARSVAFLRTFSPVVAGIGQMKFKKFIAFSFLGTVLWAIIFTLLGWGVGEFLKNKISIEIVNKWVDYITYALLGFSILSIFSTAIYRKLTDGKPKGFHFLKKRLKD